MTEQNKLAKIRENLLALGIARDTYKALEKRLGVATVYIFVDSFVRVRSNIGLGIDLVSLIGSMYVTHCITARNADIDLAKASYVDSITHNMMHSMLDMKLDNDNVRRALAAYNFNPNFVDNLSWTVTEDEIVIRSSTVKAVLTADNTSYAPIGDNFDVDEVVILRGVCDKIRGEA